MKNRISRRQFLKAAAGTATAGISLPYIVPSSVSGKTGTVVPSERITIGCIGVGWQGTENLKGFLNEPDARVVAVCDIDANYLKEARELVDSTYGNKDCVTYHDFLRLLGRDDIDAVCLSLPDHWHAIAAIEAAKAGKDIYGEKPLSHSFTEGRAICEAMKRYGMVWQTGSWQRSVSNFRFACELVLNGCIGKIRQVEVALPSGHVDFEKTAGQETACSPPTELDYDKWLGPAPYAPYCPARVHKNWRWVLDYGGGQLMDWVGHHADIAHWGLGLEYTGPIEIEGRGRYPRTGLWNSPTEFHITTKYANGVIMIITSNCSWRTPEMEWWQASGTKWVGENGWVQVSRVGIDANPKNLLKINFGPDDIKLYRSAGHYRNFLDCVKSRQTTLAPCEVAHRSATPGHLGQIAMRLGRKIRFNPDTEEIIGDPTATRLLSRAMRSPWHL